MLAKLGSNEFSMVDFRNVLLEFGVLPLQLQTLSLWNYIEASCVASMASIVQQQQRLPRVPTMNLSSLALVAVGRHSSASESQSQSPSSSSVSAPNDDLGVAQLLQRLRTKNEALRSGPEILWQ